MEGERSGLFYEALRIIDELKPAWAIWENVPGLLSSDGGRDLARVMFSMVEHGYSGCYRVFDSQWFGVAQRRRRLFGVFARGDSGAERAAKVLSLAEGLRRHPAPERTSGKGFAADTAPCLAASGRGVERVGETRGQDPVVAFQGQASDTAHAVCYALDSMSSNSMKSSNPHSGFHAETIAKTLQAGGVDPTCNQDGNVIVEPVYTLQGSGREVERVGETRGQDPVVAFDMSHADDPARLTGDKTNALQARMGTGGNQVPCIAISDVIHGDKQCNGKGRNDSGVAYTLDTRATQGVCAPTSGKTWPAEVAPTLNARFGDKQGLEDQHALNGAGLFVPTAMAHGQGNAEVTEDISPTVKWGVRRLTPMECERLQGFRENWTASLSDAQRYKALGNAVTVNVAEWIAKRLIKEM